MHWRDNFCRCLATVQWGWGTELVDDCCTTASTGIQSVRPKLVKRNILPPRSLTRARDDDESKTEGSCLKIAESGKTNQALDPVDEDALKHCKEVEKYGESCQGTEARRVLDIGEDEALKRFKGVNKLGVSCQEVVGSGNSKQDLNAVEEDTLLCCKEVRDVDEQSFQQTVESVEERREKAVECCKEVAKLGLQGGDFDEEKLNREILYRSMLEENVIERELTFSRVFTRALVAKGGKLVNRIRRESGAIMEIIRSSEVTERVVLRGTSETVNKAEQMLEELLSSAVEISVSAEEIEALLSRCGKERGCILDKIRQRISVPLSMQGMKAVIFGKPEETKVGKEIFEEELRLVRKILSTSSR